VEAVVGSHIEGFEEFDEPRSAALPTITGPAVVAASWFAPAGRAVPLAPETRRLTHGDRTVAWVIPAGDRFDPGSTAGRPLAIEGVLLSGTYSLLDALDQLLLEDCAPFRSRGSTPAGGTILGEAADVVSLGALVEPGVVFDVRSGPIVLDAGAEVRAG